VPHTSIISKNFSNKNFSNKIREKRDVAILSLNDYQNVLDVIKSKSKIDSENIKTSNSVNDLGVEIAKVN